MSTTHPTSTAVARIAAATDVSFMADGGLETAVIFLQGVDLPDFAAFPLLDTAEGRAALADYYAPYLDLVTERGLGLVLDTPTWRANPDWGDRLGYDRDAIRAVNARAVDHMRSLAAEHRGDLVLNGAIGPRGDGYVVGEMMTATEAAAYHRTQIDGLADGGADLVTAVTMTNAAEAIGIATSAAEVGIPAAIGFTVETDGRLPSGQPLDEAIAETDAATGASPAWYMINCAHPSHFEHVLQTGEWRKRIRAVRANASRMSHAELDEAPELDRGDIAELADDYRRLAAVLPNLVIVGGCCGTDHEHLHAITGSLR